MIICSCNLLTDHDVRGVAAASASVQTVRKIYGCLGCSPQCGRCARTIRRIMVEAMGGAPVLEKDAPPAELDAADEVEAPL